MSGDSDVDYFTKQLLPQISNAESKVHKRAFEMQPKRTTALILFTILLDAGIIVIHSLNPCINQTSSLFAIVTGVFGGTVLFVQITTAMYFWFSYFCDEGLLLEHQLDIAALHCGLASTLGFYDFYTYLPADSGPYAAIGSAIQFIFTFFLIWIAVIEKHRHNCLKSDETALRSGSPHLLNFFYFCYYFSILCWFSLIGLAIGFDWQLWVADRTNWQTCL